MPTLEDVVNEDYTPPDAQARANLFAGQQKPIDPSSVEAARELGYDLPTIDLDPKGFGKEAEFQKNSRYIQNSPAVASYLAEDPINGQVSHKDLGALSDFAEPWLTQGAALMNYYLKGMTWQQDWQKAFSTGYNQTNLNRNVPFDLALNKIDRKAWESQRDEEGLSPIASMVGSFLGSTASNMQVALPSAATGAGVGAALGGPVGAAAGAGIGFTAGLAGDFLATGFGSSYREYDAIRDANGQPLPESTKIFAALGAGTVMAIGGAVGGKVVGSGASMLTSKIMGKVLTDPIASHMITKAAEEVFRSGLTFGGISAGMEFGTVAAGEIAKQLSGRDFETVFNNSDEIAKAAQRISGAAVRGFALGGVIGTIPAGMNYFVDRARISQTQFDMAAIQRMNGAAEESETAKITPEMFSDYVEKHVGVTPFRVQAEAIAALRPHLIADSPYKEAVEGALPHGGDVEISAGAFFTKLSAADREALTPHIRGQSGLTGAEAEVLAQKPMEAYATSLKDYFQPALKPDIVTAMRTGKIVPPELQQFIDSPQRAGEVVSNGLTADIRKGRVDSTHGEVLTLVNVLNPERAENVEAVESPQSTGKFRRLMGDMESTASANGLKGVYVESVLNQFLGRKLEEYGYRKINENLGTDNYFKAVELPKPENMITPDLKAVFIANEVYDYSNSFMKGLWLGPIFETPGAAGVTKLDMGRYDKLIIERQKDLTMKAMKAAEGEITRIESKLWKEDLKTEMDNAREAVDRRPDVLAHENIKKLGKLDREEVEHALEAIGQPTAKDILKEYVGEKGDISLDLAARSVGFPNGQAMIESLVDMRREQEAGGIGFNVWKLGKVKEAADAAMEEKHGNLQDRIMQKSVEAAISVEQLDVMAEDFKQRFGGQITRKGVMDYARDTHGNLPIAEARDIQGFMSAVARKGQQAESWLLAGKPEEALKAKQEQLYNFGLLQEAKKFAPLYEKGKKTINKYSENLTVNGVDQESTDQIHNLLQLHNLPIPRSPEHLAAALTGKLETWAESLRADGVDIELNGTTNSIISIAFQRMNAKEFGEFKDTLDSIVYHGKQVDTLEVLGRQTELKGELTRLSTQLSGIDPQFFAARTDAATRALKYLDAMGLKMEQIADWIDGDDIHGVFNKNVIVPFKAAQHLQDDLITKVSRDIGKLESPKNLNMEVENNVLLRGDGTPLPMTRKSIIAAMLNMGNKSNLRVLLEGYRVSAAALRGLVDKYATEADWKFVQGYWDAVGELWPFIEKASKEATGVAPERIVPNEIQTKWGTVKGGYWPLIRDNTQDKVIGTKGPFDLRPIPLFVSARSFKNRTGTVYPIDLTLDLVPSRIRETIHAAAFKTPVREAWKILNSDEMKNGIKDKFGQEYLDILPTWIKDVANDGRRLYAHDADAWAQGILADARTRTVTFLVGTRPSTMLIHGGAALSNSIGEIVFGKGAGSVAERTVEFARATKDIYNPSTSPEIWKFIDEHSGEIRNRPRNIERDLTSAMDKSFGKSTFYRQQQFASLAGITYLDMASARIVWLAKYRLELKDGAPPADAIQLADKAVRKAHGSQSIMDQADIQRGVEYKKIFTMFYGYFNHNYNRERDIGRNLYSAVRDRDASAMLAETMRLSTYVIGPAIIHELVRGERKEDESYPAFVARTTALQGTSSLYWGRDVGQYFLHGITPKATPLMEMYDVVARAHHDIKNWQEDKNENPHFVRDAIEVMGLAYPGIMNKTTAGWAQTLWDNASGTDRGEQDTWRLLLEGNPTPKRH